jgi:hypothetical protein
MNYASYEDYYEPLEEFVSKVLDGTSVFKQDLSIANNNVRLVSSYKPLVDTLKPAIEHLSCDSSNEASDFTIFLIDLSRVEGGHLPSIPWEPLLRRGHRGIHVDGLYMQFVHIKETDVRILSAYDSRKNQAYYIVSSTEKLPWYISGAPMHEIIYWWVRSNNMHILHCGVIGDQEKGIALLGAKGAGKSTTVLSCLENGFHYISEDYCIVTSDEVPVAYNLYNSAKFTDYTLEKFPHLAKHVNNKRSKNSKYLVYYKDIYPDRMVHKLPLSALVSLNLNIEASPLLKKIDVDQAFLDMISSTTLQNPTYELSSTDFFQKLKKKLPAYELTYGRDTKSTIELLSTLMT